MDNETPVDVLFRAIADGDEATVERLVNDAPELARARDAGTLLALQFARYTGRVDILERLIAAGPPLDVFEAATIDRADRVRYILRAEPEQVRAYSSDGFTALHFAAYFGSPLAAAALLDAGADIEGVTKNFLTNMPIHAAAAGGHLDTCELLLKRGANVNATQHGDFRALHAAAFTNNRAMAELFLAHRADPTLTNDEGKTAAEVAAGMGNMELAALLRARSPG